MSDVATAQVTRPTTGTEGREPGFLEAFLPVADDQDGPFAVLSNRVLPGADGPAPHAHERTAELFRVVEGTLRITMGDQAVDVEAGGAVAVPAGMPHAYSNPFDEPAVFLTIMSDDVEALDPGK